MVHMRRVSLCSQCFIVIRINFIKLTFQGPQKFFVNFEIWLYASVIFPKWRNDSFRRRVPFYAIFIRCLVGLYHVSIPTCPNCSRCYQQTATNVQHSTCNKILLRSRSPTREGGGGERTQIRQNAAGRILP